MAVRNIVFFVALIMLLPMVVPKELTKQMMKDVEVVSTITLSIEHTKRLLLASVREDRTDETCRGRREIKGLIEKIHNLLRELSAKAESCPGCCPTGWVRYGQSCYYTDNKPTYDWREAVEKCWNVGGQLTTIKSAEQNSFLFELVKKRNTLYGAWVGLIRAKLANHFSWIGSLLEKDEYQNWRDGEPNNETTKETCVYMWGPKHQQPETWEDVPCNLNKSIEDGEEPPVAVCQRSL